MPTSKLQHVGLILPDPAEASRARTAFEREAPEVRVTRFAGLAAARAAAPRPDVWIADLHLADGHATELFDDLPSGPLVILVPPTQVLDGIEALEEGAVDWAQKTAGALDALPHLARGAWREWRESVRRKAAERRLRHADRLTTVGRIAAGVFHEVGTPLNVIRMQAQLLQLDPADVDDATRRIVDQCDRIADILRRTLDLSRASGVGHGSADLLYIAEQAASLLAPTLRRGHVAIEVRGEPTPVAGDAQALLQVVLNLLTNALDAMPDGGRISLTVRSTPPTLAVHDTGPGVPPELGARLFEAFFTTKAPGAGTGLGLHVSSEIAAEHGGRLTVDNHPDGGARFTLTLPDPAGAGARPPEE